METFRDLSVDDLKLIAAQGTPQYPRGHYDIDEMQIVLGSLYDRVQPLASFVLNRVNVWLEGDGRWGGDEVFDAAWDGNGAERSCTLTRKSDGATWIVDWYPKQFRPEVTEIAISSHEPGVGSTRIAHGDLSLGGKGAGGLKVAKGAVEGRMRAGALDDLCRFAQAVRGSMPPNLLVFEYDGDPDMDWTAFLPAVGIVHAAALEKPLLAADGGLPGRLCQARYAFVTSLACGAVGNWMRERLLPLAEGLRGIGAEWGKAFQSYNDGDYSCAVVDFQDGSVGLFSDNAATGFDQHAYVARIRPDWDSVGSVEVHIFDNGEDYQAKITAIDENRVSPDFVYDYEARRPFFPGGRNGWAAMNLFFSQFTSDSNYALEEANLEADVEYWRKQKGAEIC